MRARLMLLGLLCVGGMVGCGGRRGGGDGDAGTDVLVDMSQDRPADMSQDRPADVRPDSSTCLAAPTIDPSTGNCGAGNACTSTSQCCPSLECQLYFTGSLVCCIGVGQPCTDTCECCGQMLCGASGTCACQTAGQACVYNGECCNGTCAGGACN